MYIYTYHIDDILTVHRCFLPNMWLHTAYIPYGLRIYVAVPWGILNRRILDILHAVPPFCWSWRHFNPHLYKPSSGTSASLQFFEMSPICFLQMSDTANSGTHLLSTTSSSSTIIGLLIKPKSFLLTWPCHVSSPPAMIWTCHQIMRLQLGLLIVSAGALHLSAAEEPGLAMGWAVSGTH